MRVIVVHGGAGRWDREWLPAARKGIEAAVRAGYNTLVKTRSALEAVLAAVRVMEDDVAFNCGRGSSLTIDGKIQMDAALMTSDGRFGAVAAIESVAHPIDVAYKVMTETSHLLIAGRGANRLARYWGFPPCNLMTRKSKERLARLRAKGYLAWMPEFARYLDLDTVGAVALDAYGRLAAANSTGGYVGKLPGRVGDTPIYGAGTWADRHSAVTATGIGEEIIRQFLSKSVSELMRSLPVQQAVDSALKQCRRVGLIALSRDGDIGIGFTTQNMPWAWIRNGELAQGE